MRSSSLIRSFNRIIFKSLLFLFAVPQSPTIDPRPELSIKNYIHQVSHHQVVFVEKRLERRLQYRGCA